MSRHLVFYTDTPGTNGAERVGHSLALALRGCGYRLTYVQHEAKHELIDERQTLGVEHVFLPPDNLYDPGLTARSLTDAQEPMQVLKTLNPDGILFSDGAPMSSLMAKRAARTLKIPYVVTTHCVNEGWRFQYADFLAEIAESFHAAVEVVCVCQSNLEALRGGFGLESGRGRVIVNGRPAEFFEARDHGVRRRLRSELGIDNAAVATLTVGQLSQYKGHVLQLAAMARLRTTPVWPKIRVMWAGEGLLRAHLLHLARKLRVDSHLKMLGYRDDVPDLLDAVDVFVSSSKFEGMPLVVLEAMAKGLPVVATAVCGVPEALGDTGHLLPDPKGNESGVVTDLATTLSRWVEKPELRGDVGASGRVRASRFFREERAVQEHVEVVEQALGPP